jgi:hypothetical protein
MATVIHNSTDVSFIDYAGTTLTVGFRNGVYEYYDVPRETYEEFLSAASKGAYVHDNIIDVYDYKRIR